MRKSSLLRWNPIRSKDSFSDDELMAKVAENDHSAFTQLFDRHSGKILGYARRLLGDSDLGEEIAQEVWMKILRSAPNYKAEDKFIAWAYTIVRNTAFRSLTKKKEWQEIENNTLISEESIEDDFLQKEETIKIKSLIEELPDQQRVALIMSLTEDMDYEKMAEELRTTVSAVKSLLFRARRTLKKSLGSRQDETFTASSQKTSGED